MTTEDVVLHVGTIVGAFGIRVCVRCLVRMFATRGHARFLQCISRERTSTMDSSKLKIIGYWVTTGLTAAAFVLGGAMDAAAPPPVVAFMAHLGYPAYFATLIGVWKVLGGIAVLAPRFPRLKEWAYAGMFFDLTGAAVSHAATGDGASKVLLPLVLAGIAVASWSLRPQSRKIRTVDAVASEGGRPGEI